MELGVLNGLDVWLQALTGNCARTLNMIGSLRAALSTCQACLNTYIGELHERVYM
jgi:hypothetical protein